MGGQDKSETKVSPNKDSNRDLLDVDLPDSWKRYLEEIEKIQSQLEEIESLLESHGNSLVEKSRISIESAGIYLGITIGGSLVGIFVGFLFGLIATARGWI